MTGLSVSQHNRFGSETMLMVTYDERKNLEKVRGEDFSKWTGKTVSHLYNIRSGNTGIVSLEDAVKINSNAGKIFELNSKNIKYVYVHEIALNKLKEYSLYFSDILIELEKETPGITTIMNSAINGTVIKIGVNYARAVDNYFSSKFETKVFDSDNLFSKYVKSELKNVSSIPPTREKRPHQEGLEPREYKRIKVSVSNETSENYSQGLNSTSNNAAQFVKTIPNETELTTLNFNQDDQSWLRDPSTTGNGSNIPSRPPQAAQKNVIVYYHEQRVAPTPPTYSLSDWEKYNPTI